MTSDCEFYNIEDDSVDGNEFSGIFLTVDDVADVCRACLKKGDVKPIFKLYYKGFGFQGIFEACTLVHIETEDKLPQNICENCIVEMIRCYKFIFQCRQSDIVLKTLLNDGEIHVKEETTVTSSESENNNQHVQVTVGDVNVDCEEKIKIEVTSEEESLKQSNNIDIRQELKRKYREQVVQQSLLHCGTCDSPFKNIRALLVHCAESQHPRPKNSTCEFCGRTFAFRRSLWIHLKAHSKEMLYMCSYCGRKFGSHWNLKRHVALHTGEKRYSCETCGKKFIQKTTLVAHLRSYHRNLKAGEQEEWKPRCKSGGKNRITNVRLNSFNESFKQHLLEDTNITKAFECKICGRNLKTKKNWYIHDEIHRGKRYACDLCNKTFSQLAGLTRHKLIHSGEKQFVCEVCSRSFRQKAHLMTHTKTHTGEKNYECLVCGKRFALNGNLTVHLRTHTGEAVLVCEVCGKGFNRNRDLEKHKKKHEKDDLE